MNDLNDPADEPAGEAPPIEMSQHTGGRHRLRWILAACVIVPLLGFTLYAGLMVNWSYSTGTRAGILQKFSRRGWVCKTWEGELAMTTVPGVAPTLWSFSVRDAHAAEQVDAMVGRHVALHYSEHRGVPTTCFGDTQYYVDSVAAVP